MHVVHFGTFDVENFGDLLFPLVLRRRLLGIAERITVVSPVGGPPVWGECAPTVAPSTLDPEDIDAVVVGGGNIIHDSPSTIMPYGQELLTAVVSYPQLWHEPARLAALRGIPVCWNAPGVPAEVAPDRLWLFEWAISQASYLSVRDEFSRRNLVSVNVGTPIHVVIDTALEVRELWSKSELDEAWVGLFRDRGREPPRRTLAVHVNSRYDAESPERVALFIDSMSEVIDGSVVLLALGPCHGDDELARAIGAQMRSDVVVIDQPRSLREVVTAIAHAEAYVGSSLHGMITACAFGRPGLVVANESAGSGGKFSGFLQQVGLVKSLVRSWEDAAGRVPEVLSGGRAAFERIYPCAAAGLDAHWNRLRQALERTRRDQLGTRPYAGMAHHGGIPTLERVVAEGVAGLVEKRLEACVERLRTRARAAEQASRQLIASYEDELGDLREQVAVREQALNEIREEFTRIEEALDGVMTSQTWRVVTGVTEWLEALTRSGSKRNTQEKLLRRLRSARNAAGRPMSR